MTKLLRIEQEHVGIKVHEVTETFSYEVLSEEFTRINSEAFHLAEPTTIEEACAKLNETDLYLRAYRSNKLVGFALYQLIPSSLGSIIYQSRGILPEAQGTGLGKIFPKVAVNMLRPSHFIAKAQNPISIWSSMRSGIIEKTCPIEETFEVSDEMQQLLMDTVLARGKYGEVDMATGLHPSSYPMGKLGDYTPQKNHTGVSMIAKKLANIGVDALNGDAIYYGGRINEDTKSIM